MESQNFNPSLLQKILQYSIVAGDFTPQNNKAIEMVRIMSSERLFSGNLEVWNVKK